MNKYLQRYVNMNKYISLIHTKKVAITHIIGYHNIKDSNTFVSTCIWPPNVEASNPYSTYILLHCTSFVTYKSTRLIIVPNKLRVCLVGTDEMKEMEMISFHLFGRVWELKTRRNKISWENVPLHFHFHSFCGEMGFVKKNFSVFFNRESGQT